DQRGLGITVIGLVRDVAKARRALAVADREDLRLVSGDVREPIAMTERIDIVIHGASPARPALHAASPVDTIRANVQGTFNLLDLCIGDNPAQFVLMSSSEVYGQQPDDA